MNFSIDFNAHFRLIKRNGGNWGRFKIFCRGDGDKFSNR